MQPRFYNVNLKLIPYLLIIICAYSGTVFANDHQHETPNTKEHTHGSHSEAPHQHEAHEHSSHSTEAEGHQEHEESELEFTPTQLKEFSIELTQAKSGVINNTLALTGEVVVEPERLYHVVPRVSGVVLQVFKHLGDSIKKGDLLATLSSRDLADAKVQFVAADSLLRLSNENMQRERKLYQGKVSSKRKYLSAKQEQAEMSVKRKAAKQRLLALGLTSQSIRSIIKDADKKLTLYQLYQSQYIYNLM